MLKVIKVLYFRTNMSDSEASIHSDSEPDNRGGGSDSEVS